MDSKDLRRMADAVTDTAETVARKSYIAGLRRGLDALDKAHGWSTGDNVSMDELRTWIAAERDRLKEEISRVQGQC